MSAYELGQCVRIHGTAVKTHNDDGKTVYREAPQPQRIDYPDNKVFSEGVVVGSRTTIEGWPDSDEWGRNFRPIRGSARRVWLVAFDLRMKPCMCFDHQIDPTP